MDKAIIEISKIVGMPASSLVYPQIIFSIILPFVANFVCLYGLNEKMKIFGRGNFNKIASVILGVLFSLFTIKLGFIGYALACLGIGFLYFKNDFLKLGFVFIMGLLYFGLLFLV